jgi:hypothetical protein
MFDVGGGQNREHVLSSQDHNISRTNKEQNLFSGSQYSPHQQTNSKVTIFLAKKSFRFYIDFLTTH